MPLIRYIYGPDIRKHGNQPVVVEEVQAKVLTEMRRAVRVSPDELEDLPKADLQELAEQVGAEAKPRDSKGHFAKAITKATEQ